jgi:hypothetical protein
MTNSKSNSDSHAHRPAAPVAMAALIVVSIFVHRSKKASLSIAMLG